MTIELTREQEQQLNQLVNTGVFDSAEQFITYSLAAVSEEDAEHTAWLKAEVQKGLASLDAGKYSNLSTAEIVAKASENFDAA